MKAILCHCSYGAIYHPDLPPGLHFNCNHLLKCLNSPHHCQHPTCWYSANRNTYPSICWQNHRILLLVTFCFSISIIVLSYKTHMPVSLLNEFGKKYFGMKMSGLTFVYIIYIMFMKSFAYMTQKQLHSIILQ